MRAYNDRILLVEKASFVPLIYTTTGGMGPRCEQTHKLIAELIAEQRNEKYADVMSHSVFLSLEAFLSPSEEREAEDLILRIRRNCQILHTSLI